MNKKQKKKWDRDKKEWFDKANPKLEETQKFIDDLEAALEAAFLILSKNLKQIEQNRQNRRNKLH